MMAGANKAETALSVLAPYKTNSIGFNDCQDDIGYPPLHNISEEFYTVSSKSIGLPLDVW